MNSAKILLKLSPDDIGMLTLILFGAMQNFNSRLTNVPLTQHIGMRCIGALLTGLLQRLESMLLSRGDRRMALSPAEALALLGLLDDFRENDDDLMEVDPGFCRNCGELCEELGDAYCDDCNGC